VGKWARIEGTPGYVAKSVSPAANYCDWPGQIWTDVLSDMMLPNGMKNDSTTILGIYMLFETVF
jgi:hypothetical protein